MACGRRCLLRLVGGQFVLRDFDLHFEVWVVFDRMNALGGRLVALLLLEVKGFHLVMDVQVRLRVHQLTIGSIVTIHLQVSCIDI